MSTSGGTKLFVSGIPKQRSEAQVKEGLLRLFPSAEDVVVVMVSKGINKGHAFVHFPSAEDVVQVLSGASPEQPILFDGAPLSLRQTVRKQPPLPAPSPRQLQHQQAKAAVKAAAAAAGGRSEGRDMDKQSSSAVGTSESLLDGSASTPQERTDAGEEDAQSLARSEAIAAAPSLPAASPATTSSLANASPVMQAVLVASPRVDPTAPVQHSPHASLRCDDEAHASVRVSPPAALCSTAGSTEAVGVVIHAHHDGARRDSVISSVSEEAPCASGSASFRVAFVPQPAALSCYPASFTCWVHQHHPALLLSSRHPKCAPDQLPIVHTTAVWAGTLQDVVRCLHRTQILTTHQTVAAGVLDRGKWFLVLDEAVEAASGGRGAVDEAAALGPGRRRSASERLVHGFLGRLRALEPETPRADPVSVVDAWKPLHGRCTMPRFDPLFCPANTTVNAQPAAEHLTTQGCATLPPLVLHNPNADTARGVRGDTKSTPVMASTVLAALHAMLRQEGDDAPPPPPTMRVANSKRQREAEAAAGTLAASGRCWVGAFKDRSGRIVLLRDPGQASGLMTEASV